MKTHRSLCAGTILAECLVYISVFFILTGIAYAVYYRSMEFSRDLRRNTDDIGRALRAGESWRQDVRRASGPLRQETREGLDVLVIPHSSGNIAYWFRDGTVWRLSQSSSEALPFCGAVKSSKMIRDVRQSVTAWRWELELKSVQKAVRLKPLFSFLSVPGSADESRAHESPNQQNP